MGNFKGIAAFAALAAGALAAAGASAQVVGTDWDFPRCDGYDSPGRTTDGITRGVSGFTAAMIGGTESGQLRRARVSYGHDGIDICTALLDHRWMLPEYRLRRASLLEARGLHRLASNDAHGALADFDLAREAAGSGDALTDRSFLLGLRLVRAFARLKAGEAADAASESLAVIAARPYESLLAQSAAQLHFAAARDWPAYLRNLREIARIDPNLIPMLYTLAFFRGEFEEMIALYPQIVLNTPRRPSGGYEMPGRDAALADAAVRRAMFDGIHGYARQARGDNAGADAALASARATLIYAMAEPPLEPGRSQLNRAQRNQHAAMLARLPEAEAILESWARMIRLRRLVAEGNIEAVVADLGNKPIEPGPAALDLFEAMIRARPALGAEMSVMMDRLRHQLATGVDEGLELSVQDLASRLPEPESVQRMPSYDGSGMGGSGYRALPGTVGTGTQTIRFSSGRGSISVANEIALLRAAELARQAGHRGILILRRGGVVRSTTTYSAYGGRGPSVPSGQEAEIEIAFVDPAALPPEYAGAAWRVLDPEAVWAALSPIYTGQRRDR